VASPHPVSELSKWIVGNGGGIIVVRIDRIIDPISGSGGSDIRGSVPLCTMMVEGEVSNPSAVLSGCGLNRRLPDSLLVAVFKGIESIKLVTVVLSDSVAVW
jgi:hypothetical protein